MSTHAAVEDTRTTTDAQVIAELADAVLASVARIHADGLAALTAIAENPVRVPLPPTAAPVVEVEAVIPTGPTLEDGPTVQDEPVVEDEAMVDDEPAIEDEPVVRISEPLQLVPQPRGRHLSEAVTDEIAVQTAA